MKALKKILVVLDMDCTILSLNTDVVILDLLSRQSFKILEEKKKTSRNWAHHMQEVYHLMKKENITFEQVKSKVDSIPLNPGFKEFFQFIQSKRERFDTLILSGANTLFLKWVLEKNNITNLFPEYYTNIASQNNSMVIEIHPTHNHDCPTCDKSQCKRILLKDHFVKKKIDHSNYSNIVFAGDGENDYCLSTILKESDILFPRDKYPLYKKLYEENYHEKLKCKICVWQDAFKIKEEIQKLL